jgi:UDP-N-acetylmuramate--alanine ligase
LRQLIKQNNLMKSSSPSQHNRVHIIGIGGIGTSALARWFLSQNYIVSGSDASSSEITSDLKKQGVRIFIGHKLKNLPGDANLAIFSAAIPPGNPEIKQAGKLGIPVKSYAEILGKLSRKYKTFCVAGAHGKSTTTALLSLVLIEAGFDPTVIVGAKLKEFGGSAGSPQSNNFHKGKGNYLVLEADEYNASFLNYSPFAAIILNIDREHLDFYKNLTNVKKSFLKFISNVQSGGILVLNKDDKNLSGLKNKIQKIAKKNNLKLFWYSIGINQHIYQRISASLKIPGEHNVSNALGVYTLAKALGIKDKIIFSSLSRYRGAWRRMEYRGNLKSQISNLKIPVYDDYAHHPTEIRATLAGIAQKWPKTALICVFQPHQAKRLSLLFKDFMGAFDGANYLVLLPIYQVQGRDSSDSLRASKVSKNVDSKKLAEAIQKRINWKLEIGNWKLRKVVYLPYPKKLAQVLKKIIENIRVNPRNNQRKSAIVVMMGAGDIYKYTNLLLSYGRRNF